MEGMKEVAMAYFDRSSNAEMASAVAFFKSHGGGNPGKGKVNLSELIKSLPSNLSNIIGQLDEDGDGMLDFDQVLAVYYMTKRGVWWCSGCGEMLQGPYFSCRLCVDRDTNTFELCFNCYRIGNVAHEHSLDNLIDNWCFLRLALSRVTTAENSLAKKDMEDLHEIAQSHYQAGSEEIKDLARKFFDSLDTDGDGKITLTEFLDFTKHAGHAEMSNPHFFEKLDKDGNGTLDFFEVMKLYYIIRSGRPFCDACNCFISGTFFSCVVCFFEQETTYDLCHGCYNAGTSKHGHGDKTQFLDNYTLLQVSRNVVLNSEGRSSVPHPSANTVPQNLNKWEFALNALDKALGIADIIAMTSSACTIM